jgi:hypothetical protein
MNWEQLQEYLKGKTFLIGLTFVNKNGVLIEQYQTHGTVVELTNHGLFKIKRKDDSIFQMPYDRDTIKKADKGEYREKATGEIVKDPDFIMTWEITTLDKDNLEDTKRNGYIPAEQDDKH